MSDAKAMFINLIPCPRFRDMFRQGKNTYNYRYDTELTAEEFFHLSLKHARNLRGDEMYEFIFDQFDFDSKREGSIRADAEDSELLRQLNEHYEQTTVVHEDKINWSLRFTAVAAIFYLSATLVAHTDRKFIVVSGFDPKMEIDPQFLKPASFA